MAQYLAVASAVVSGIAGYRANQAKADQLKAEAKQAKAEAAAAKKAAKAEAKAQAAGGGPGRPEDVAERLRQPPPIVCS